MATTPVYANDTWGEVIAVMHNGTRVNRPLPGQTPWTAPAFDCGTVTVPNVAYPDAPVVVVLGKRTPSAIMLPNSDARISPAWTQLVASGNITDEMLLSVEEPLAAKVARRQQTGTAQLQQWFDAAITAGLTVPEGRFGMSDGVVALLVAKLLMVTGALAQGVPGVTELEIADADGETVVVTYSRFVEISVVYDAARTQLSLKYATCYRAIRDATTVEEIDAAIAALTE